MPTFMRKITTIAVATLFSMSAYAQSAKEVRGASPYVAVENEPAPRLVVDPPLPQGLAIGVFWAQYRVENLRIVPVFGAGTLKVSPRIGHLHITVDDLPWWWADASDSNTIDIAGFLPGEHKVKIELVTGDHNVVPGQAVTLKFTVPEYDRAKVHPHAPPVTSLGADRKHTIEVRGRPWSQTNTYV